MYLFLYICVHISVCTNLTHLGSDYEETSELSSIIYAPLLGKGGVLRSLS